MPGRALLARRLHRSVDTVDRSLKELVAAGILTIERRSHAGRTLTNRYHLRTHDPDGACEQSRTAAAAAYATTQAPSAALPGDEAAIGGAKLPNLEVEVTTVEDRQAMTRSRSASTGRHYAAL